ncbi:MAG: transposase family protein [Cyclobacteriaceae bacterium]
MEHQRFFSEVKDFRVHGRCLHRLEDVLMLSLCAVICGAEDFEDIEIGPIERLSLRGICRAIKVSLCWLRSSPG